MASIRCPHCGSPVMIRGNRWECGWCGDFGGISSLHPSERAKLLQRAAPSISITVTVTDTGEAETEAEETPRSFSRTELEDMVRRWDFSENEQACRDLLIAAFPAAAGYWSAQELSGMDVMDLLVETGARDPETASRTRKRRPTCWGTCCTTSACPDTSAPGCWSSSRPTTAWPGSSSKAPMWAAPRRTSSSPAPSWGKRSCGKSCWIFYPATPSPTTTFHEEWI